MITIDSQEVIANLNNVIANTLPETIEQGLETACFIVEADAKTNCPVRDGQLIGSIKHTVDGNRGEIGSEVEYAPYVEVGTGIYSTEGTGRQTPWKYKDAKGNWHTTRGMKAQPYLKPALERNRQRIIKCFEGLLK